ncbi:hypothetical protein BYT27DRAFT_7262788 [Phlegmacium glaucopus]|nr:hypothetical protein BYT27DRAFT_7262788 [Phlegmacium glaucopus]
MPSTSNTPKRKASAPASGNKNKAARTSNSRDAPTSKRQAPTNELTTDKGTEKENAGEPTGQAVRANHGRGRHAYQLENALNPIMRDQARKANEGIPENVPENPMAPRALCKARGDLFPTSRENSDNSNNDDDGNNDDNDSNNDNNDSNNDDNDSNNDKDNSNNENGDNNNDDNDDSSNNSDDDIYYNGNESDKHMEINEASPSEDEAAAQAALRSFQDENLNDENDAIDVLEDHRMRNRPVHPPHPEALANAAAHQSYGHQLEDDDLEADENEDDDSSTHRAHRYSKTPRDAEPKPTTMKYYPSGWQTMLEMAKNNMRRHVALVNAFPQRDRDLKEATLILNNTVTEYQRIEGNALEPEYSPDRDMSILVESYIPIIQHLLIPCLGFHKIFKSTLPTQIRRRQSTRGVQLGATSGSQIAKGRSLSSGGEDENGKCKNIAHPAIPAVIHEFFYADKDCLAALYCQDFEHTVPDYAIALVMTCIQNCLEEYADYGYRKPITLDGDTYRVVMKHHLHLIDTLKGHAYHGAQYEACRTEWAWKGMQLLERDEAPVAHYAPALQLD